MHVFTHLILLGHASVIFKRPSSLCQNQYGDIGTCLPKAECAKSRGVNIGSCPRQPENTCCLHLPCSSDFIADNLNKKRRRKRAILHASVVPAKMDPVCGLRLDDDLSPEQQRNQLRQEQLINGITLDWRDNRFPWMLALWIVNFPISLPTCGAALISNKALSFGFPARKT